MQHFNTQLPFCLKGFSGTALAFCDSEEHRCIQLPLLKLNLLQHSCHTVSEQSNVVPSLAGFLKFISELISMWNLVWLHLDKVLIDFIIYGRLFFPILLLKDSLRVTLQEFKVQPLPTYICLHEWSKSKAFPIHKRSMMNDLPRL